MSSVYTHICVFHSLFQRKCREKPGEILGSQLVFPIGTWVYHHAEKKSVTESMMLPYNGCACIYNMYIYIYVCMHMYNDVQCI